MRAVGRWELRGAIRRVLRDARVERALVVAIVVSTVLLAVERLLPPEPAQWATWAGDALVWGFRVELALRLFAARHVGRTAMRFAPDIIAVLPLAPELRALRVLRVLRLLRAGAILARSARFGTAAEATVARLANLAAASLVLVVFAATLLVVAEQGALHDYDEALWYSVLSLIAGEPVGGEPVSDVGRGVTLVLMLGGLTVFGVFVGTVSGGVAASIAAGLGLEDASVDEVHGHIVVLGWNRSAPVLLDELFRAHELAGHDVVLVTEGACPEDIGVRGLDAARFHHVQGDWTRLAVLEQVGIARAAHAILLTDETTPRSDQDRDARTVLAALLIERTAQTGGVDGIHTVAEVTSDDVAPLLAQAGVESVVRGDWYAGVILGAAARNPGLVPVLDEVLSTREGAAFFTVPLAASWDGQPVSVLHRALHERHEASLIALHAAGTRAVNPAPDTRVRLPAEVVVLAHRMPSVIPGPG